MSAKRKARCARFSFKTNVLLLFLALAWQTTATAQANEFSRPCPFNAETLQFSGAPSEQAKCLLRKVKIQGAVGKTLQKLPPPLDKLIGQPVKINRDNLRFFLKTNNLDENVMGGSLDSRLSMAKLPNGEMLQALYFVIHDTSDPYLKDAPFPVEINDADWIGNNLDKWSKLPVAHVFVNRAGESITVTDFSEPVAKGWGTKFARDRLKADGKGLELHIELVQPRRRALNKEPKAINDAIAPQPGFGEKQYQRLALLYVCASVRRGSWLVPAFHAAIDAGIKDAHDDPQNFDLKLWAEKLAQLIKQIK